MAVRSHRTGPLTPRPRPAQPRRRVVAGARTAQRAVPRPRPEGDEAAADEELVADVSAPAPPEQLQQERTADPARPRRTISLPRLPSLPRLSGRVSLPSVLVAVAVVLAVAGGWMLVDSATTRSSAAASNRALVDVSATAEVSGQVSEALNRLFSYRFDTTALTEQAAKDTLAGPAREQYDKLFEQVRQQAPQQKLTLNSKVVVSGVRMLEGDQAVLLVFLDQTANRGDTNQSSASAAQLTVNAQRIDGRWRITELQPR